MKSVRDMPGLRSVLFIVMELAGMAYGHLFQVMKNKDYYLQQCYTIFEFYLS